MPENHNDNSKQKRGLGRGLGSLLGGPPPALVDAPAPTKVAEVKPVTTSTPPTAASSALSPTPTVTTQPVASAGATTAGAAVPAEGRVWQVGIDKLKPGIYQPRRNFEKAALQELAQSIKENGILQPLIVRKTLSGQFELVAGERRWRAAQLAGLHEVPVLIRNYEDKETLELSIIENVQREDLDAIEEAEAYARLAQEFHLSQQQISDRVGKERATVANAIRLLALPREIKDMISRKELSVGHAKVLLSLPDPRKQIELAKRVINEKLAVRKLEKVVTEALSAPVAPERPIAVTPGGSTMNQLVSALGDELQKMIGTKVQIDYDSGKGKISISYYSNEELNEIVDKLKAGYKR